MRDIDLLVRRRDVEVVVDLLDGMQALLGWATRELAHAGEHAPRLLGAARNELLPTMSRAMGTSVPLRPSARQGTRAGGMGTNAPRVADATVLYQAALSSA